MPKDYAKKTKTTKAASRGVGKKKKPMSHRNGTLPGLWMVAGVVLGVFAAALVFLKAHHVQQIQHKMQQALQIKPPAGKTAIAKHQPKQPEFDFYTMLPKETVWEPKSAEQPMTSAPAEPAAPIAYIVQVAAFQHYQDADKLKAQLLLEGYAANVNSKSDNGWNHVWLGPFKTLQDAQAAQIKLAKSDKLHGLVNTIQE